MMASGSNITLIQYRIFSDTLIASESLEIRLAFTTDESRKKKSLKDILEKLDRFDFQFIDF